MLRHGPHGERRQFRDSVERRPAGFIDAVRMLAYNKQHELRGRGQVTAHHCATPGIKGRYGCHSLIRARAGEILEPGSCVLESEADGPDWAVSLLRDDDFCGAAIRAVGVIDFVAVDEEDHVGVLLDGA